MSTEQLSMSMFASRAGYDAAARAQPEQPTGLQLAVKLLAQIGDNDSDRAIAAVHAVMDPWQPGELPEGIRLACEMLGYIPHAAFDPQVEQAQGAIRAEHHQRVTMQHHACDLAQRVADLEAIVSAPRGTGAQIAKEREIAAAAIDGALAFGYQGTDAPEAGHWLLSAHNAGKRIAEMEAERDELRARLDAAAGQEPSMYALAQYIRSIDGRHSLGAGVLAERMKKGEA